MERRLLVLDKKTSPWFSFLEEFFEDTAVTILKIYEAREVFLGLDKNYQDIFFANPGLLSPALIQKLRAFHASQSGFRVFQIGKTVNALPKDLFNALFEERGSFTEFQRELVEYLPLPEKLHLLVVDNEPEIGNMIREFLERRVHPSFQVDYASNGEKGLQKMREAKPDVVILDIKMPVKDGREVYREMVDKKLKIPVIIFFDAISGEEISEIRRIGKPAIVEKGSHQSHLAELVALIKKKAYFG